MVKLLLVKTEKVMYRIRSHTLLCLQGFKGEGYSEAFVARMKGIHEDLFNNPGRSVEIVAGPDDICSACPNLGERECTLDGKDAESDVKRKDDEVAALLGIYPGRRYRWEEILERISGRIPPAVLKDLCGNCRWYSLGYCEEGIEKLKNKQQDGGLSPENSG